MDRHHSPLGAAPAASAASPWCARSTSTSAARPAAGRARSSRSAASRPVRALPARPADPAGGEPVSATKQSRSTCSPSSPATPTSCPGCRRRCSATTASSRGRRSTPRAGAPVEIRQINNAGRDLNVHLHGGVTATAVRRPAARRDPQRHASGTTSYPNVAARRRRSGTTTTRTARPRRRSSRAWPAFYILGDPERRVLELPAGRLRRPADDPGPRVQRRRLVPLQARRRPRLPRRHDPGQRRGRAAHEGRAAAVPAALPQRLERARVRARRSATAATMVQIASDGGLLPAPVARTSIPMEPAERVEVLVDFRQFGVGSR